MDLNTALSGRIRRTALAVGSALLLISCGVERPNAAPSEQAEAEPAAFSAGIRGAYEGEISGDGVLRFLPGAGFENSGYYFLADGQGIRPHGVTFVLPRGTAVGRHELSSPSPLDIGDVPSVRVDRDMGDSVVSSDENTAGFLNLTAFPGNEDSVTGASVEGDFEFETSDSNGRRIVVSGEFAFEAQ